ncbi:MAG TPA: hypothetical protein VFG04_13625 [Planctomycetaceae bacterium]|jgi:hypothetical protein|nr:hypothetical protein [Planctomycetaceae bacterium]
MYELLTNPWLALCTLTAVIIVLCTAIVFVTEYLQKSRQAAIDAYLKQDMLSRGMSAAEIKTVLEASSEGEAARRALSGNPGVRVGLGKFHIKVGELRRSTSDLREPAALKS